MTDIDAKAREIVRDWFGFDLDDDLPSDHDLAKIIAAALHRVCNETEAATWAAAEAIARDYDDWTFWGQYDNAAAAQAASIEIAEALTKRRPLTTEEIYALDTSKGKSAGGKKHLNRVRNEALEEAAKVAEKHFLASGGVLPAGVNIATAIRALKEETGGRLDAKHK